MLSEWLFGEPSLSMMMINILILGIIVCIWLPMKRSPGKILILPWAILSIFAILDGIAILNKIKGRSFVGENSDILLFLLLILAAIVLIVIGGIGKLSEKRI